MKLLVVNLHSSENAGDHALTRESIRQLRRCFEPESLVLSMNDPASGEPGEASVGSFITWLRPAGPDGTQRWRWLGFLQLLAALLAGLLWRMTGRLLPLGLPAEKQRLLRAFVEADAVVSCAGGLFYTSGRVGVAFLVTFLTMAYGWLLGKPLYTLPQSVGPLRLRWEGWLLGCIARRCRLMLLREPVSVAILEGLGAPPGRYRLVPDLAFAYTERDRTRAEALLRRHLGDAWGRVPLLGITMMNWGAQSRLFEGQAAYEAGVVAACRRFLAETEGHLFLFSQVWGPTEAEDDRIPARRVAAALGESGRVHLVDEPLDPPTLKGCYGQMGLLLGTRMHSNIFALSEGTPVLAVGYRVKSRGIMEMMGMPEWVIPIEEATPEALPARLMAAWQARERLRRQVAGRLPTIRAEAEAAVGLLAEDFFARSPREPVS